MSFQNKNKYFFVIPKLEIFDGTNRERSKQLATSWQSGSLATAQGVWILQETYFMVLIF